MQGSTVLAWSPETEFFVLRGFLRTFHAQIKHKKQRFFYLFFSSYAVYGEAQDIYKLQVMQFVSSLQILR